VHQRADFIEAALAASGAVSLARREPPGARLGVPPSTLENRIKALGIDTEVSSFATLSHQFLQIHHNHQICQIPPGRRRRISSILFKLHSIVAFALEVGERQASQ